LAVLRSERIGAVTNRSDRLWTLATHVEDVSPEETARGGREFCEKAMRNTGL
jgi:hypothetical protein